MSRKQQTDPKVMLDWNAANCASPIVNYGYISSAIGKYGYTPIRPLMTLMRYSSITRTAVLRVLYLFSKSHGQSTYALEGRKVVVYRVMPRLGRQYLWPA